MSVFDPTSLWDQIESAATDPVVLLKLRHDIAAGAAPERDATDMLGRIDRYLDDGEREREEFVMSAIDALPIDEVPDMPGEEE